MLKKLVKYGNSNALVLDKTILALLDLEEGSLVKMTIQGNQLMITAAKDVDVKDKSSMFTTKNHIELTDCRGKLVFSSRNGFSKLKDFEKAYRQSIRMAFSTIQKLDSVYSSSLLAAAQLTKRSLVQNIQEKNNKMDILATSVKNEVDTPKVSTKDIITTNYPLLYAQKIDVGYQLINTKPAIVFVLLKTNDKNKFIIKDKNGTLVNSGNFWIAEYYEGDDLVTEIYQIKF